MHKHMSNTVYVPIRGGGTSGKVPFAAASALPPRPHFYYQLSAPIVFLWALTRCLQANREKLGLLHSVPHGVRRYAGTDWRVQEMRAKE